MPTEIKREDSSQDGAFESQKVFVASHKANLHYTMIPASEIENVQVKRIREVSEETGISEHLASALLMKNGWQPQQAIDALCKDGYLMKEFKFTLEQGAETMKANKEEEEFCCECCYCEAEPHEIVEMPDCGHRLCVDCFGEYCVSKLKSG